MKITSKTVKPMNVRSRKQTGPATAHWRRTSKELETESNSSIEQETLDSLSAQLVS